MFMKLLMVDLALDEIITTDQLYSLKFLDSCESECHNIT